MHSAPWLAGPQLGPKTEDLQIQPDEDNHQAQSAVPLHVLGSTLLRTLFNKIEIQDQIKDGNGDHKQNEADTELG